MVCSNADSLVLPQWVCSGNRQAPHWILTDPTVKTLCTRCLHWWLRHRDSTLNPKWPCPGYWKGHEGVEVGWWFTWLYYKKLCLSKSFIMHRCLLRVWGCPAPGLMVPVPETSISPLLSGLNCSRLPALWSERTAFSGVVFGPGGLARENRSPWPQLPLTAPGWCKPSMTGCGKYVQVPGSSQPKAF